MGNGLKANAKVIADGGKAQGRFHGNGSKSKKKKKKKKGGGGGGGGGGGRRVKLRAEY